MADGEYTPTGGRPWSQALRASEDLDRVTAEFIERLGKIGADELDLLVASQVLMARSSIAVADSIHALRQELSLVSGKLEGLTQQVEGLRNKFPALG